METEGHYTQGDVHLLNWLLAAKCEVFNPKGVKDGRRKAEEMFMSVWNDPSTPAAVLRVAGWEDGYESADSAVP